MGLVGRMGPRNVREKAFASIVASALVGEEPARRIVDELAIRILAFPLQMGFANL